MTNTPIPSSFDQFCSRQVSPRTRSPLIHDESWAHSWRDSMTLSGLMKRSNYVGRNIKILRGLAQTLHEESIMAGRETTMVRNTAVRLPTIEGMNNPADVRSFYAKIFDDLANSMNDDPLSFRNADEFVFNLMIETNRILIGLEIAGFHTRVKTCNHYGTGAQVLERINMFLEGRICVYTFKSRLHRCGATDDIMRLFKNSCYIDVKKASNYIDVKKASNYIDVKKASN